MWGTGSPYLGSGPFLREQACNRLVKSAGPIRAPVFIPGPGSGS